MISKPFISIFIRKLREKGKTEDEASSILSEIIIQSLSELYSLKIKNDQDKRNNEIKLQSLLSNNTPNAILFKTLGISPDMLSINLEKRILQYL